MAMPVMQKPRRHTPSHQPYPAPDPPQPSTTFSEADIDRFATLFSPATPPASPTLTGADQPPTINRPATRPRKSTESSSDSEFGSFVSVAPAQDPLWHDIDDGTSSASASQSATPSLSQCGSNVSLVYFDQFTSSAKTSSERHRREVLDELLNHQDDPMYFLHTQASSPLTPTIPITPEIPEGTALAPIPAPIPILAPTSADDALAEALASELHNPKLIHVDHGGSVKVAPSHTHARIPLPPRLSGSTSPPSISSHTRSGSATSLPPPSSTSPMQGSGSIAPAHATLSRISSSLVSLLPSRPRSTAPVTSSAPSSVPSSFSRSSLPSLANTLTHGSPFASTPYIPPTGAPGFAGDRAWDRGFSDVLEQEEKRGLVDPVGLGVGVEMSHTQHTKGKGVTLVGRREGTVRVLTEELADLIRLHLPALIKLPRHWTLLYSLDQHGISLNTLYARCEPRIPSRAHPNPPKGGLLAIQDAHDAVFGAWVSEGIHLEKGSYYGSGESFLWRYHAPINGERQGRLEVYNWTGANAYVALCEPGFISFGGGDGHYGLWLDASLLDGSSAACPTFGNPPLCAPQGGRERSTRDVPFECVGLEVWGVGTAS